MPARILSDKTATVAGWQALQSSTAANFLPTDRHVVCLVNLLSALSLPWLWCIGQRSEGFEWRATVQGSCVCVCVCQYTLYIIYRSVCVCACKVWVLSCNGTARRCRLTKQHDSTGFLYGQSDTLHRRLLVACVQVSFFS